MSSELNAVPPIYGFIAQPVTDPKTGQTVYVAAGEPVLMPTVAPDGTPILVYQNPPVNPPPLHQKGKPATIVDALNNIGNSVTQATGVISREFTKAFNDLFS